MSDTQAEALRRFRASLAGHALTTSEKAAVLIALDKCADEMERLTEWQPIASAPKDGTKILAWCVHQNAKYASSAERETWEGPVVARWIEFNGGGWSWNGHFGHFTHWMPLPLPPNA